jgi:Fe-S-cluster-containing dehydrogenase component
VHNCSCKARYFGDLDDPDSAASKAVREAGGLDSKKVHSLDDRSDAKPSTLYILSPEIATWKGLAQ